MTRATLASIAAAVALVLLTPSALADHDIGHSAQQGVGDLIKSFFKGIGDFVGGIFLGFIDGVVKPFFGIFGGFFSGIGTGLQSGASSIFSEIGPSIKKAYETMTNSLEGFGPLAPILVVLVFLGIIWLFLLTVRGLISSVADNFLPEAIEKRLKDEDDE